MSLGQRGAQALYSMSRVAAGVAVLIIVVVLSVPVGLVISSALHLGWLDLIALVPTVAATLVYVAAGIAGGEHMEGYPGPTSMFRASRKLGSRLLLVGASAGFAIPILVGATTLYFSYFRHA